MDIDLSTTDFAEITLTLDDADLLKLVSGNAGGPMLFMTRKIRSDGRPRPRGRPDSLLRHPPA